MRYIFNVIVFLFCFNLSSCCCNIGKYSIYTVSVKDPYHITPGTNVIIKTNRIDIKLLYSRFFFQKKLSIKKVDSLGQDAFPCWPFSTVLSFKVRNAEVKDASLSIEDTSIAVIDSVRQFIDSTGNKLCHLYIHTKKNGKTTLFLGYNGYEYSEKKIPIRIVSDTIFLFDNPRDHPLYN